MLSFQHDGLRYWFRGLKDYRDDKISIMTDFINKKSKGSVKKTRIITGISKRKTNILR